MRRGFFTTGFVLAVLALPTPGWAQATVNRVADGTLVLTVGSRDGVKEGITGKVLQPGAQGTLDEIASFKVVKVDEYKSEAMVLRTGAGERIAVGDSVRFDQPLRPPTPTPRVPISTPTPKAWAPEKGQTPQWYQAKVESLARAGDTAQTAEEKVADFRKALAYGTEWERSLPGLDEQQLLDQIKAKLKTAEEDMALTEGIRKNPSAYLDQAKAMLPKDRRQGLKLLHALEGVYPQTPGLGELISQYTPHPGMKERTKKGDVEMTWIPPGTFRMGCPPSVSDCPTDTHEHRVTLTKGFWLATTETTMLAFGLFESETDRPTRLTAADLRRTQDPAAPVSWKNADAFCHWLGGRLPTEAEWEYAARGGKDDVLYPWGKDEPVTTPGAANGAQLVTGKPTRVASFQPNAFGLFDMAGNVSEFVLDWYVPDPSAGAPENDPVISTEPESAHPGRVYRGGDFHNEEPHEGRVFVRHSLDPTYDTYRYIGFRCAMDEN